MSVCSMNVIWTYYIRHVVISVNVVSYVISLHS